VNFFVLLLLSFGWTPYTPPCARQAFRRRVRTLVFWITCFKWSPQTSLSPGLTTRTVGQQIPSSSPKVFEFVPVFFWARVRAPASFQPPLGPLEQHFIVGSRSLNGGAVFFLRPHPAFPHVLPSGSKQHLASGWNLAPSEGFSGDLGFFFNQVTSRVVSWPNLPFFSRRRMLGPDRCSPRTPSYPFAIPSFCPVIV